MPKGPQGHKRLLRTLRWTSIGWAALAIFLAWGDGTTMPKGLNGQKRPADVIGNGDRP